MRARKLFDGLRRLLPAVAIIVQLLSLAVLMHAPGKTALALALHVSGAVLAAIGLRPAGARSHDAAGFLLLNGTIAGLCPVAGVLAACALKRIVRSQTDDHERSDHVLWDGSVTHFVPGFSVDADIDALKDRFSVDLRDDRSESRNDMVLAESLPYRLRDRNPEVRRDAIRPLARLRTDHAASILREVMHDNDEQVRLLAQNAMQSIRDRHDEILTGLGEALAKNPGNALNHLRLADSYSALAAMNLERDSDSAANNRAKAAAELDLAAALSPPDTHPEMAFRLLRRSLILGRKDMAEKFVRSAARIHPDDARLKEAHVEISYMERDWPEMLLRMRELPPAPSSSPLFRAVKNFWLPDSDDTKGAR